ncbi:unnamed protein product [Caenorhabditis bovis]|uniref:Epoxide hydrolase N-terminal domain-containing protein n=1 Tax=Caenorhabditis bovis TaxID=2654633 RepID=A0A8S1EC02_9PELO|nr:unnamed protein product [Caenorhabditis bovis]
MMNTSAVINNGSPNAPVVINVALGAPLWFYIGTMSILMFSCSCCVLWCLCMFISLARDDKKSTTAKSSARRELDAISQSIRSTRKKRNVKGEEEDEDGDGKIDDKNDVEQGRQTSIDHSSWQMSSFFFYSVLFISIISIFISIYFHKPQFPPLEIDKDGYWKPGNPVKDDDTIYSHTIKIDETEIQKFKNKLASETRIKYRNEEYDKYLDRLFQVIENFDWKQHENFLNTFKQYRTEIEGLNVHFARISTPLQGKNKKLVPILLLHGFPGSFWDFFKLVPILSNPSRHGFDFGVKETIQFDVIIPSIPGFVFSEKPEKSGFDAIAITRIIAKLMDRLDIDEYFVHGCQGFGSDIATLLTSLYPDDILGLHLSNPFVRPTFSTYTLSKYVFSAIFGNEDERGFTEIQEYFRDEKFSVSMSPEVIGTSLQNSPMSTVLFIENEWKSLSSRAKTTNLFNLFTLDEIATEIYIYWLTSSAPSALQILNECYNKDLIWLSAQPKIPTAVVYSKESPWLCSENLLSDKYLNITRKRRLAFRAGKFPDDLITAEKIKKFTFAIECAPGQPKYTDFKLTEGMLLIRVPSFMVPPVEYCDHLLKINDTQIKSKKVLAQFLAENVDQNKPHVLVFHVRRIMSVEHITDHSKLPSNASIKRPKTNNPLVKPSEGYEYYKTILIYFPKSKLGINVKSYNDVVYVESIDNTWGSTTRRFLYVGDAILKIDDQEIFDVQKTQQTLINGLQNNGIVTLIIERATAQAASNFVRSVLFWNKCVDPQLAMDVIHICKKRYDYHVRNGFGPEPKPILRDSSSKKQE